ncbi:MAG: DUF6678 family protein [Planctomycetaceae bacterium]
MFKTNPAANVDPENQKEKYRRIIEAKGLVGAASDQKWRKLLDAMRLREGWHPLFRCKFVDGVVSTWDGEWWYHLPLPMMSVHWFDIQLREKVYRAAIGTYEWVDHQPWVQAILEDAHFCYDIVGDIARIHGYLPKSLELLEEGYSGS